MDQKNIYFNFSMIIGLLFDLMTGHCSWNRCWEWCSDRKERIIVKTNKNSLVKINQKISESTSTTLTHTHQQCINSLLLLFCTFLWYKLIHNVLVNAFALINLSQFNVLPVYLRSFHSLMTNKFKRRMTVSIAKMKSYIVIVNGSLIAYAY